MVKNIDEQILFALKNKELNILQIAELIKKDRHTTAKYLEVLKSKGLINFQTKGKSKLWSLSKNPLLELLDVNDFISSQVLSVLNNLDYAVTIQSKDYEVVWHNDKLQKKDESKKENKCYELIKGKHVPCKNCLSDKTFQTGNVQKLIKNQELNVIMHPIKNEQGDVLAIIKLSKLEKVQN
jgi:hypothetical protein